MRLSILNFFSPPHHAFELVARCEELGYHRFWVGEHHSEGQVPDALAFVMIAAGTTERIRIGTGAVSLVFRNPYLVAESAITAELFFPDRIDLGVTKAASVSPEMRELLLDGCDYPTLVARYDDRVRALRDTLARSDTARHSFLRSTVPVGPQMYLMVTNAERARAAGEMGVGMVVSFHHGGTVDGLRTAVAAYRERFQPSPLCPTPCAIVVVSGMISDDPAILASASTAEQEHRETYGGVFPRTVSVFEGAERGAAQLRGLGTEVGADEVMFLCVARDCEDCYVQLARGWASHP